MKILFKGITRRAKEYELFLQREWNVSTFSFMKVSGQSSPEASTWSLAGPVVSDEEGPGKPGEYLMVKALFLQIVYEHSTVADSLRNAGTGTQMQYPHSPFQDSGSAFSWRGDVVHPDEAIQPRINQPKQYTESHAAKAAKSSSQKQPSPERYKSISAQIAAFKFSTLVPMEILRGWGPTHRVILKTGNASLAQYDLIKLSRIWSQAIGSTYSPSWSASYQLLRGFSDVDVEKLCKLMEEGLHRFTYWSLFARLSMKEKEGAVDEKWWLSFGKKLNDIGHPNSEALYEQLVAVGLKYIDVDALETARALTNALNLVGFPDKGLIFQNREGNPADKKTEHTALTQMGKAITSELTSESPASQVEISLVTKPQSRHSMPVCQPPTTTTSFSILPDEAGERIVMPSRNCYPARKAVVSEAMYGGELISQDMCNITLPEEPTSTEIMPSSPDMMEQVIASLDAAIGQPLSSPEPMKERTPSQIPRPLTMRKSQTTLFKSKSTSIKSSRQKRQDSPHEPASPRVTREKGWISAGDIEDFDPANITWEDVVYTGPSHMSNKAKGKLPVDLDLPISNILSRLYSKGAQSQMTLPNTITGKSVSKPVALRVGPEPCAKSQDNSVAGPSGHSATRSTSLSKIQTSCANSVQTVPGKPFSNTMPLRPRAHSHSNCQAGLAARDITRPVSMSFTRKPSDLPTLPGNEAKTPHTSPRPIVTRVSIQGVTSNSSIPSEKDGVSEDKTLRAPLGPGLLESSLPGIPVPRRTTHMPGTFVESDVGFAMQRYGPEDVVRPELSSFPVATVCQETPQQTSFTEGFVFFCPEDLQSLFTNARLANVGISDLPP